MDFKNLLTNHNIRRDFKEPRLTNQEARAVVIDVINDDYDVTKGCAVDDDVRNNVFGYQSNGEMMTWCCFPVEGCLLEQPSGHRMEPEEFVDVSIDDVEVDTNDVTKTSIVRHGQSPKLDGGRKAVSFGGGEGEGGGSETKHGGVVEVVDVDGDVAW